MVSKKRDVQERSPLAVSLWICKSGTEHGVSSHWHTRKRRKINSYPLKSGLHTRPAPVRTRHLLHKYLPAHCSRRQQGRTHSRCPSKRVQTSQKPAGTYISCLRVGGKKDTRPAICQFWIIAILPFSFGFSSLRRSRLVRLGILYRGVTDPLAPIAQIAALLVLGICIQITASTYPDTLSWSALRFCSISSLNPTFLLFRFSTISLHSSPGPSNPGIQTGRQRHRACSKRERTREIDDTRCFVEEREPKD